MLSHSAQWIHLAPALLAVGFAFLFVRSTHIYWRVLWGALWLLFLPNTIYILTDLEHFARQWSSENGLQHVDTLLQYAVLESLGVVTFLLAFLPFENALHVRNISQSGRIIATVGFNVLIAFAMVMGKEEHINSWLVLLDPMTVAQSAIHIMASGDLWGLTMLFGILCNGVYFLFRATLLRYARASPGSRVTSGSVPS